MLLMKLYNNSKLKNKNIYLIISNLNNSIQIIIFVNAYIR